MENVLKAMTLVTLLAMCSGKALSTQTQLSEREIRLLNMMMDNFDNLNRSWCDLVNNVEDHFQYNAAFDCLDIYTCDDVDDTKDIINFIQEVVSKLANASCFVCYLEQTIVRDDSGDITSIRRCVMSSFVENEWDSSPIFMDIQDLKLNLKSVYTRLTYHNIVTPPLLCDSIATSATNMLPFVHSYLVDAKILLNTMMTGSRQETTDNAAGTIIG